MGSKTEDDLKNEDKIKMKITSKLNTTPKRKIT